MWVIFRPSSILCVGRFLHTKKSSSYNIFIFRQKTEYDDKKLPILGFIIHLLNIEESRIQSFHVAVLDGITHFYILYIPVIRIAPILQRFSSHSRFVPSPKKSITCPDNSQVHYLPVKDMEGSSGKAGKPEP